MSNRRKIKNNKTNNHQMNNGKVNKTIVDCLKKVNISTTLVTKLNKNSGPMVVDFGTKKDMEDYINKVKKHQLPEELFEEIYEKIFNESAKELSEELNEELDEEILEEIRKELREKVREEFYEGIEIFKPYLENNKIGLIRIF